MQGTLGTNGCVCICCQVHIQGSRWPLWWGITTLPLTNSKLSLSVFCWKLFFFYFIFKDKTKPKRSNWE
jgi:hypothetical protein